MVNEAWNSLKDGNCGSFLRDAETHRERNWTNENARTTICFLHNALYYILALHLDVKIELRYCADRPINGPY
jgi:hypothetical protein